MPDSPEDSSSSGGNIEPASEITPLLAKLQTQQTGVEGENATDALLPSAINGFSESNQGEERQDDSTNRLEQYQGLPDVKKQLKFILPAVSVGVFLSACDQTIIISSYGRIGSELKALNNTSWIATAYLLSITSFQPLYGKISDIFGRKPALLSAYAIFGVGCLFCGLARDMNELIAARAFAGIGGGGMTTVVSILLSDIIPLRERGTWQGIINLIFAAGSGTGAPLGGFLADSVGWRWAFLGQVPLCVVAFVTVLFALQLPKVDSTGWKAKLKRMDFLGAFVLILAVFSLLLALDQGSNVSWTTPIVMASFAITIAMFALFMLVEQRYAVEPFAPWRVIFEKSLFASYLCYFFSFAAWFGILFYLPLYYQAVDGFTATQAGVRILPGILTSVIGSLAGGMIMQKTGRFYWLTVIAYVILTLSGIPLVLATGLIANSTYGISTAIAFGGFALGIGVTTTLIALIANAAPEDQAIATACSYLFRSLGSAVGVSLISTVIQQSLKTQLRKRLHGGHVADEIVRQVRESLESIKTLEPDVRDLVRECYANAARAGFTLVIGIASGAMIASGFIKEKKLSR